MISFVFALLNFLLGLAFAPFIIEYFNGKDLHGVGLAFAMLIFIWDIFFLFLVIAAAVGKKKKLIPWMLIFAFAHNAVGTEEIMIFKSGIASLLAILLVVIKVGPFQEFRKFEQLLYGSPSSDQEKSADE